MGTVWEHKHYQPVYEIYFNLIGKERIHKSTWVPHFEATQRRISLFDPVK